MLNKIKFKLMSYYYKIFMKRKLIVANSTLNNFGIYKSNNLFIDCNLGVEHLK